MPAAKLERSTCRHHDQRISVVLIPTTLRNLVPNMSSALKIFTHRFCADEGFHPCKIDGGPEHQESPSRATAIVSALRSIGYNILETSKSSDVYMEAERLLSSYLDVIKTVHDKEYLEKLRSLCDNLETSTNVPLTPRLLPGKGPDGSTLISRWSYVTAVAATGTCIEAADWVLKQSMEQNTSAFCIIRPPGHHAGLNVPDSKVGGCGFCLLNHAAIVAAYLRTKFDRVAIVDIDVHHGNGTQECLQRLGKGYFYGSVHLYEIFDDNPDADFFPGTGNSGQSIQSECVIVNCPIAPLWQKPLGKRARRNRGRDAVLDSIENLIVPRLKEFAPDALVISAGFDGAHGDEGNLCENVIKSGLNLMPDDFKAITAKLASTCTRIISLLEGGYGVFNPDDGRFDRKLLVECVLKHIEGLKAPV